jgi:hypothetical protein
MPGSMAWLGFIDSRPTARTSVDSPLAPTAAGRPDLPNGDGAGQSTTDLSMVTSVST